MKFLKAFPLIIMLLFACKPSSQEKQVAEKFLRSFSRGDYENARKYVTKASLTLLFDFENIGVPPDTLKARPITWSIDSIVKQCADTAKVYYLWNGFPEEIFLVKEKGHWKIAL